MRYIWLYLAALLFLLVVLPWFLVSGETLPDSTSVPFVAGISSQQWPVQTEDTVYPPPLVSVPAQSPQLSGEELQMELWLVQEQRAVRLPLEEYIACVLAGEMPALFDEAALQAQAIAIRTYTLKRIQQLDKRRDHPEGDLCDQPGHCQAYLAPETLLQRWQQAYASNWPRIQNAVQSTAGLVLSYRGQLIDALYHSTCGGKTEYASEVWGGDPNTRPYLVSVFCPWDHDSNRYSSSNFFSWQELGARLGLEEAAVQVALVGSQTWNISALTAGGRVKQATLLGQSYSGTTLRNQLGLNSTQLRVTQNTTGLTFEATGYGHGVGLCQYGANGYAKTGAHYIEILGHYYTGVTVLPDYGR